MGFLSAQGSLSKLSLGSWHAHFQEQAPLILQAYIQMWALEILLTPIAASTAVVLLGGLQTQEKKYTRRGGRIC